MEKAIVATRYLNHEKFAELMNAGHAESVSPGVAHTYSLAHDAHVEWIAVDNNDPRVDTFTRH